MTMQTAELLDLYNFMAGRASADLIQATTKYTRLTQAERKVIGKIATVCPWTLYPKVGTTSLPTCATTDQNVFTFLATDGVTTVVPFGDVQLFLKPTDVPDLMLRPGWDYFSEGNQIRLPRNRKYTGTLYWRGIVMPAAISATENPHLIPDHLNELTAIRAVRDFAASGNIRNAALLAEMNNRWREFWPECLLLLKRQFSKGGALTTWSLKDVVTPLL